MKLSLRLSNAIALLLLLRVEAVDAQLASKDILHIVVPRANKSAPAHDDYYPKLLALALDKTRLSDGDFKIESTFDNTTNFRKASEISNRKNAVTIMWASTSPALEANLLPIRFSVLAGLNSYRVLLIRKEDQERFLKVKNLTDLKGVTAGQGAQWADTAVLKKNELPVVSVVEPEMLFNMLAAKRFDYFPRGLYEVWEEQIVHADKGLVIETSLLLHYSSPVYFFVNKKDVQVANRIERGLKIAKADGSFDRLLHSVYGAQNGFDEIKNPKRKRIELIPLLQGED